MVQIELDRPRNLKYGLAAIRDLESALGGRPLADIIRDLSRLGINALLVSLYHGLKHEDPTLNVNLLLKMLDKHVESGESLQPIYHAINEALEATGVFRTTDEVSEGKAQAPAPVH